MITGCKPNAFTGAPPDVQPNGKRKSYLLPGLAFAMGMVVAFLAAWLFFGSAAQPELSASAPEPGALSAADLAPFLAAARDSDYPAMRDVGESLFREGARIAGAENALAEYATNSVPPYTVYAFYSAIGPDSTRRVLLTLDGEKVVSFMAEEMEIIQ